MRCIIIDDETNAIKALRWEIENYLPEMTIQATFDSAVVALNYLKTNDAPDLVFLDIEMPDMNGFDFINKVPDRNFEIIFTTAYSEFALEALKKEAVDYLLKPIDSEDLVNAIGKLKKRMGKNHQENFNQTLEALKNLSSESNKIKISFNGKINFMNPEEIIYLQSDGNYSKLFLQNGKEVLITHKLKVMEEELPENHFFRVHKSYIINVKKITSFYKNENFIVLNEKINIPLARSRKAEFVNKYL